jgi:CSLREA domain-containing protein
MAIRPFASWGKFVQRLMKRSWQRTSRRSRLRGRNLRFEQCEDRSMLATFTVNSMLDGTDGTNTTLREAIGFANASLEAVDTIKFDQTVFASGGTILLTQGQLSISESSQLIIDGWDTSGNRLGITIDANDPSCTALIERNT